MTDEYCYKCKEKITEDYFLMGAGTICFQCFNEIEE